MDFFYSLAAGRLIFILGVLNIVCVLWLFMSCRCLPGSRLARNLMQHPRYKRFFSWHCYVWWVFLPSVVLHALLAVLRFGWPG
jgi:hypothetical protein